MALTLTAFPSFFGSVHDNLIYTVSDPDKVNDPVTYPNFKFIADVYIGSGVGMVARLKAIPDPVTGIGIFNVGMIARNFVSSAFDPVPDVLLAQQAGDNVAFTSVQINFGEEWNYTPTFNILIDGFRLFFNSYNGRGTTAAIGNKFNRVASNRPANMEVFLNSENLFLPYFPATAGTVPIVIIPTGGGFPLTTSFTPGQFNMCLLNLTPNVINSLQPGTINASTTSYTVQITDHTYTVKIICEGVYQPYVIHFLNQYGGFDTKLFTKVNRDTITITKTDYGKLPYTVGSDGSVSYKSENGVFNELDAVYASLYVEKMSLNTDLLTDQEYVWLKELLISPLIFIEDQGSLFPVKITDSDYEAKKVVNDDLTNLTINIQFGNQLNAQYR